MCTQNGVDITFFSPMANDKYHKNYNTLLIFYAKWWIIHTIHKLFIIFLTAEDCVGLHYSFDFINSLAIDTMRFNFFN